MGLGVLLYFSFTDFIIDSLKPSELLLRFLPYLVQVVLIVVALHDLIADVGSVSFIVAF